MTVNNLLKSLRVLLLGEYEKAGIKLPDGAGGWVPSVEVGFPSESPPVPSVGIRPLSAEDDGDRRLVSVSFHLSVFSGGSGNCTDILSFTERTSEILSRNPFPSGSFRLSGPICWSLGVPSSSGPFTADICAVYETSGYFQKNQLHTQEE